MVPYKTEGHSHDTENQQCAHGAPAEDEESVGESRELPHLGGSPGETTPGKLTAGAVTPGLLESDGSGNYRSASSLSGSPTSMLCPSSADSPLSLPLPPAPTAAPSPAASWDAPGVPQAALGASAGLRQSFHRCAESLHALGRGPTSGVPVVQPSLFMDPQDCEGQEQGEGGV